MGWMRGRPERERRYVRHRTVAASWRNVVPEPPTGAIFVPYLRDQVDNGPSTR